MPPGPKSFQDSDKKNCIKTSALRKYIDQMQRFETGIQMQELKSNTFLIC